MFLQINKLLVYQSSFDNFDYMAKVLSIAICDG